MKTYKFGAIIFASTLGLLLNGCTDEQLTESSSATMVHNHSEHEHSDKDLLGINPQAKKPEIKLSVEADPMAGWNIHIDASNFSFAPDQVNQAVTSIAEGHAHIYVDDYKIARVYSPWYHLRALTPGPHKIRISLNANDHSNLSYNGIPLDATINIIQH